MQGKGVGIRHTRRTDEIGATHKVRSYAASSFTSNASTLCWRYPGDFVRYYGKEPLCGLHLWEGIYYRNAKVSWVESFERLCSTQRDLQRAAQSFFLMHPIQIDEVLKASTVADLGGIYMIFSVVKS